MADNHGLEYRVLKSSDLDDDIVQSLRALFDREYLKEFGAWEPSAPYGYAPHDVHVIVVQRNRVVAHVGYERRKITVGGVEVLVGGTGGVLVAPELRGSGAGRRMMVRAQQQMREDGLEFGYLGCRDEVVPFYESAGWHRIRARETYISRGSSVEEVTSDDGNILICDGIKSHAEWPGGPINIHGRPW